MSKRILIVEDAEDFRRLLQQVVEAMGYDAVPVDRATRAWRVLQEDSIALVLLDIKMPQIRGHDLVKYMRKRGRDVPVIVISGYLNPEILEVLLEHRIRQVIAKPFKFERLTREIHAALEPDGEVLEPNAASTV